MKSNENKTAWELLNDLNKQTAIELLPEINSYLKNKPRCLGIASMSNQLLVNLLDFAIHKISYMEIVKNDNEDWFYGDPRDAKEVEVHYEIILEDLLLKIKDVFELYIDEEKGGAI